MAKDLFYQLKDMGVGPDTLVEMGVIEDIIENIAEKLHPSDQGVYIFVQMLSRLFYDEINEGNYGYSSRSYADMGMQYMDYDVPMPVRHPMDALRRKAKKKGYGMGFEDSPQKQKQKEKPPVFSVDMIYTEDDQVLYILTNPNGMVDEYTKFTNLEKYATSKNGTLVWLGEDEKRPMSLLWNGEDDEG